MYYRWKSEIRAWRNTIPQADMVPFTARWFDISLISCEPVSVPIPSLEFTYPSKAPLRDLIFSASGWEPHSSRLRQLLRGLGIQFEEFPCRLIDKRTGDVRSDDYAVVHLLECRMCMDTERSVYSSRKEEGGREILTKVRKLYLQAECEEAAYPLFRLAELRSLVLAHDTTRSAIIGQSITGVDLVPLPDINV